MSQRRDFDDAFQKERYGSGASVPTTLVGRLGQHSARQQQDLIDGRMQGAASGALLLEMIRGGAIRRGAAVGRTGPRLRGSAKGERPEKLCELSASAGARGQ